MLAVGLLAAATLAGCGAKSSATASPTTEAAPSTTVTASSFCTDLTTAMNGITALASGAVSSNKNAAESLFTQLATYLERLAPSAPDNLGPALTTMAASFRAAGTVVNQQGGTKENVFADPTYLAATKQFVTYSTSNCKPS